MDTIMNMQEYREAYDKRIRQMAIDGGCETEAEIEEWIEMTWERGQSWMHKPTPYRYIREARQKLKEEQRGRAGSS